MALPAPIPRNIARPVLHPIATGTNRISAQLPMAPPTSAPPVAPAVTETHQIITNLSGGAVITIPLPGISYYFEFLGTLAGVQNNFAGLIVRAVNAGQPRSSIIHVQGTGLRFGTVGFSQLEVQNNDPVNSIRFTLDIGGGITNNTYDEYLDKRVILSAQSGTIIQTTRNATTLLVGFKQRSGGWADTLAGGTSQAVTDGFTTNGRKAIIFSNDDVNNILQVLDSGGNIAASVYQQTAFYAEVNGTITLKNPNVGAVTCHISEIYYQ